ncbi:hypothetical protein NC652_018899 [Populus alba x Populus x berolinensis]|nr:hypothetical protein NC652_018899 [Populus alba x Populus x berolinensis]
MESGNSLPYRKSTGGSSSNSQSFLAPAARLMMRGGDLSVVAKKEGCSEVEEGEAESPLVLEEWIKDIDKLGAVFSSKI